MENTREANFIIAAVNALKQKNVNDFKSAVTKLKSFADIDKWKVNMFTKILKFIENNSEDPYL